MGNIRKHYLCGLKGKIAVGAVRQHKTTDELAAGYGVHASQANTWKKQALAAIPSAFSRKRGREQQDWQAGIDGLHRQPGQAIAGRGGLGKKSGNNR